MTAMFVTTSRLASQVGFFRGVQALSTSATTTSSSSKYISNFLKAKLKNPSLLPSIVYDGGAGGKDETPTTFAIRNPAQPDVIIGHVKIQNQDDARRAIDRSYAALPAWRDGTTANHRSQLLQEWSRLIHENAADIATIMTLESGKPLRESLGEVSYGRSFLDYYAGEALRSTSAGGGSIIPTPFASTSTGEPRGQVLALQQAVGVTALITPWNFPIAMITRKVGPALAAGCTAIVKPSELTPLTALALQTLAIQAGIPDGILEIVIADQALTPSVGLELCQNDKVSKLSFTGSTAVGKLLLKQCSDTVKRVSMELGGNAPFVVFEDADLNQAVAAAMASKFRHAGQTCVCADRFFVHHAVYDAFIDKLCRRIQDMLRVGNGMDETTTMGPLIRPQAVQSVHAKVRAAIEKHGAICRLGGTDALTRKLGPCFYEPTVLTNVPIDADIFATETFGPVIAVAKPFHSDEEVLQAANSVPVGLAGYFCTNNLSRVFEFSKRLECGLVGVNEGIISTCVAPFGGVKQSGLGREGSQMGIAEYLESKYVFINA